ISSVATDVLHAKTAAVLYDNSQDYSKGLKQYIEEAFTGKGGKIVAELSYGTGASSFSGQLTAIKAANPDFIFLPGYYTQVAQVALQARQLGITVPFIGGDGWDSDQLTAVAKVALDNCYFTNHFSSDDKTPTVQNFVKSYRAAYGHDPDAMAALGFDAAGVLIDSIKRAKTTDGAALRNAIASTKDFHGVTG